MLFSKTIVAFASLAAFASAQGTTTSSGAAPSESVTVHVIQAMANSEGKPVFEPAEVQAKVGDLIQFQFHPMNHSVVRAAFADPCVPIEESAAGNGTAGFYSGFMPVDPSATVMPTFTIMVENTNPIWFYCSQGKHCQAGMVGAINPTAQKTLSDFKSRAAQAAANLSPGQQNPGNGGSSSSVVPTATTLRTSAASTGASTTSTSIPPPNAGAKLGVSMPLVLAAIAASFFFL
jgi:plastocyanin